MPLAEARGGVGARARGAALSLSPALSRGGAVGGGVVCCRWRAMGGLRHLFTPRASPKRRCISRPNPGAPVPPLVPSAKIFKWRVVFSSLFYIRKVICF